MGILFVINILIMLGIGKLYPRDTDYIPKVTDDVDVTPWKYAIIVGIIITIMVLSTYFIF